MTGTRDFERASPLAPRGRRATAGRASPPLPLPDQSTAPAHAPIAVLALLARAARFGRPCPTDAQIAARVGLGREVVPRALAALAQAGAIRLTGARAPTLRRVTIAATGWRTGEAR